MFLFHGTWDTIKSNLSLLLCLLKSLFLPSNTIGQLEWRIKISIHSPWSWWTIKTFQTISFPPFHYHSPYPSTFPKDILACCSHMPFRTPLFLHNLSWISQPPAIWSANLHRERIVRHIVSRMLRQRRQGWILLERGRSNRIGFCLAFRFFCWGILVLCRNYIAPERLGVVCHFRGLSHHRRW